MTLVDRKNKLQQDLKDLQAKQQEYTKAIEQTVLAINQYMGAISIIDQLIEDSANQSKEEIDTQNKD